MAPRDGRLPALTMISLALLMIVAAGCPSELFRIERSKNANVVLYEAKPGKETSLDADDPVTASWLLLASSGERKKLSFFEKLVAYGYNVKLADSNQSAVLTLKALRGRTLRVVTNDGCLVALGSIGGSEAVLKRVFVTTDEHGLTPKVISIELFGVDPLSGEPRTEKILAQ